MGRYLDLLKKTESAGVPDLQNLQNPRKPSFVGFVGTPPPGFQKKEAANESRGATTLQGVAAPAWLLHFADRDPLEVWYSPPVTHPQVLADYADALAAEPLGLIQRNPSEGARGCKRCQHRARPGHAEPGYCALRTDQLKAYGPDHPLHQLPADGGAECNLFEDWT